MKTVQVKLEPSRKLLLYFENPFVYIAAASNFDSAGITLSYLDASQAAAAEALET